MMEEKEELTEQEKILKMLEILSEKTDNMQEREKLIVLRDKMIQQENESSGKAKR